MCAVTSDAVAGCLGARERNASKLVCLGPRSSESSKMVLSRAAYVSARQAPWDLPDWMHASQGTSRA